MATIKNEVDNILLYYGFNIIYNGKDISEDEFESFREIIPRT